MSMQLNDKPITPSVFLHKTGFHDDRDDIERCNCPKAGEHGHRDCGWNTYYQGPVFMHGVDRQHETPLFERWLMYRLVPGHRYHQESDQYIYTGSFIEDISDIDNPHQVIDSGLVRSTRLKNRAVYSSIFC